MNKIYIDKLKIPKNIGGKKTKKRKKKKKIITKPLIKIKIKTEHRPIKSDSKY